jgi:hypothetical protein
MLTVQFYIFIVKGTLIFSLNIFTVRLYRDKPRIWFWKDGLAYYWHNLSTNFYFLTTRNQNYFPGIILEVWSKNRDKYWSCILKYFLYFPHDNKLQKKSAKILIICNNQTCLKTQALLSYQGQKKDDIHKYNMHSHILLHFTQKTTPLHHIFSLSYTG